MTDDGVAPTPTEVRQDDHGPTPGRPRHPLDVLMYRLERYRDHLAGGTVDTARDRSPDDWATARTNDGLARAQCLDGDPSENWEAAIAAFEDALTVWTRERYPEQ